MSTPLPRPESRSEFSIGDLSREFHVTTRTIRFYEDQGLLAPRRQGVSRIYAPRDRVRLMLILRGKRLGFSIRDIKGMLEMYDAPEGEVGQLRVFIDRMRERRQDLQRQRADIDQVLGELDALEARCQQILAQQPRLQRAAGADR
jgi:DNA-binding transcriptional MerR regulator